MINYRNLNDVQIYEELGRVYGKHVFMETKIMDGSDNAVGLQVNL